MILPPDESTPDTFVTYEGTQESGVDPFVHGGPAIDWPAAAIGDTLAPLPPRYVAVELLDRVRAALVDRYDVERELGSGGMAFVYAARDLQNERPVAIKVMRPEIAAALGTERFLREIRIEQRLQHGHILPLLHSDAIDELPYYVMPFVKGETLRQRLERENQLPVEDALHIAGQVAEALDYAHREGVIHRDIKPENILLAGDTVYVADFGVARAAGVAGSEWQSASGTSVWWTSSGVVVGTPGYMSPEQATAGRQLDGRSDQYSLACVIYEMLAGERPFSGPSLQAIVAKMLSLPAPSVRVVRERVAGVLDRALRRGLAKSAADRFATCGDFVTALRREPSLIDRIVEYPGTRYAVAILTVAIAATIVVKLAGGNMSGERDIKVDTARYVIFPPEYASGVPATAGEAKRFYDAFSRWKGLSIVSPLGLEEALLKHGVPRTEADAAQLARTLRAGRYVRISVSPLGDSLSVYAGLYDATRDSGVVRDANVRIDLKRSNEDSVFASLAEGLLFGEVSVGFLADLGEASGTTSFPARQAYIRGHAEIANWDLEAADTAFAASTAFDPQYAQAFLWLAQVRAWSAAPPVYRGSNATWRSAAERAFAGRGKLSTHEQVIADALVAFARGQLDHACVLWRQLTRRDSRDFVAWYGLGSCLASDGAVIRDRVSPSGRRFRTSYREAMEAYQRAYLLLPAVHRALRSGSYASVRELLYTRSNLHRTGHGVPPDTTKYTAYPEWHGDTLAFTPYPDGLEPTPATLPAAVRQQRQLFHEISLGWVSAYPQSEDAMEALALSLEMLGDPAALDTIRRARAIANTPEARLRAGSTEVWMEVRRALPGDLERLQSARGLADSLLLLYPPPSAPEPLLLSSLAALTGRANRAAAYMRETAVRLDWGVPAPLAQSAPALLVFSALGGPIDTLRELRQVVDATILRDIAVEQRSDARAQWLARAASLAFPHYRFPRFSTLAGEGDYLVDAQAAFSLGDSAAVRGMFRTRVVRRRHFAPEEITLDGLYPEAALLAEMGDSTAAIAWLDPTLTAIGATQPQLFQDPTRSAALVQAMVLRAELARSVRDSLGATRWGRAVDVLWRDADSFLLVTSAKRGWSMQRQ